MKILLTNDDGYDAPGIQALADRLSRTHDVTVVAPADDQSAIGRVYTGEFTLLERPRGYAVTGTPVDCIVAGIEALNLGPDLIVSGCNTGANLGGHALGRSGTISAVVEGTFFGLTGIAVSLHVPEDRWPLNATRSHFNVAAEATAYLVDRTREEGVLDPGEYLNVNVPFAADSDVTMRVTRPSDHYHMTAEQSGETITVRDLTWDEFDDRAHEDGPGTDRGAVHRGMISVSPLVAPHRSADAPVLERVVADFEGAEVSPGRAE